MTYFVYLSCISLNLLIMLNLIATDFSSLAFIKVNILSKRQNIQAALLKNGNRLEQG
jgi:hypothetical protein